MDKKHMMEELVREAHGKDIFTGTWLFVESGEIVSKGAWDEETRAICPCDPCVACAGQTCRKL